jgi:tetratricopeptide (TPR) repeat protein
MFRFNGKRRLMVAAAILLAIAGLRQLLIGQTPESSLVKPDSVALPSPTPADQPTPEQIGDSLVAHRRYQAALAAYAKSPARTATLWNKMGIANQMLFNAKDAMHCYKESLALNPHNSQVLNNLGTVYASLKEYGQADRMYKKALKLDAQSALILKNLGTNELAERRYDKGWATYQRALAIDPQIFAGHFGPAVENPSTVEERGAMNYYMALGCVRAGYADCALEYLRKALDEGFTDRKKVVASNEFASLRANPDFMQLVAEEKRQ